MPDYDKQYQETKYRFIQVADYPEPDGYIGKIITCYDKDEIVFHEKYPHLFRRLKWWEDRTIEFLMAVRYVRVTEYVGYWRVGDVVEVAGIGFSKNLAHCKDGVLFYYLKSDHPHSVNHIEYATAQEYEEWKEGQRNLMKREVTNEQ